MSSNRILKIIVAILIFISGFVIQPVLAQFNLTELDDIARATTVLIAADLTQEQFAAAEEDSEAGSGVLIARQADAKASLSAEDPTVRQIYRYWVLTNAHVVDRDDIRYGIRTADGEVHPEGGNPSNKKKGEDYVHVSQIYRFGRSCSGSDVNNACDAGTDLAILTFYSDKEYPVAAISAPSKITIGESIQASGWPATVSGNSKRVRFPANGFIRDILSLGVVEGNYTLKTTLRFKHGASGGPVFNRAGELIGIYGKGQVEGEQIGSVDNYAIDIGQFLKLQSTSEYKQSFTPPAPSLTAPTPKDPQVVSFGRKYKDSGDNMTAQERKALAFIDLLPDDPRAKAIARLNDYYGCWQNYEGNHSGGGLVEARGAYVSDLNGCLQSLERRVAASTADLVTKEEAQEFQRKVEALGERIKRLKAGRSTFFGGHGQNTSQQSQ